MQGYRNSLNGNRSGSGLSPKLEISHFRSRGAVIQTRSVRNRLILTTSEVLYLKTFTAVAITLPFNNCHAKNELGLVAIPTCSTFLWHIVTDEFVQKHFPMYHHFAYVDSVLVVLTTSCVEIMWHPGIDIWSVYRSCDIMALSRMEIMWHPGNELHRDHDIEIYSGYTSPLHTYGQLFWVFHLSFVFVRNVCLQ